jgi:hypothetical protein
MLSVTGEAVLTAGQARGRRRGSSAEPPRAKRSTAPRERAMSRTRSLRMRTVLPRRLAWLVHPVVGRGRDHMPHMGRIQACEEKDKERKDRDQARSARERALYPQRNG